MSIIGGILAQIVGYITNKVFFFCLTVRWWTELWTELCLYPYSIFFKQVSVYIYIYLYIYIYHYLYWYDTTIEDGTGNFAEIHQLTWGTAPTILQGWTSSMKMGCSWTFHHQNMRWIGSVIFFYRWVWEEILIIGNMWTGFTTLSFKLIQHVIIFSDRNPFVITICNPMLGSPPTLSAWHQQGVIEVWLLWCPELENHHS